MKKISKIFAMLMAIIMVFGLVACESTSSKSLTMNVETGDSIKVKLDTSEDFSMKWDKDEDAMKISEDDDVVLKMVFADEDHIHEYAESAIEADNVVIKDTGKNSKVKYSLLEIEYDGDETYNIVGWIVGSDTGIIIQGSDSKSATMDAFEALSFSIEDTDQDDEDYYLECVVMENPNESEEIVDDEPEEIIDNEDIGESSDDEQEEIVENDETTEPDENDEVEPVEKEDEADNDSDKPASATKLSADWKDYEFAIDGNVFKLPVSYKELKEVTGYSMKSAEEKSYLEPNYYTGVSLRNTDGDIVCYIDVLNNTDEDATYADCVVVQIGFTDWQLDKGATVEFAGGLRVGDVTSKEELISMFGEPTKVWEYRSDDEEDGGKYDSDTYTWSEDEDWTTTDNFEIEMNISTGVIEEIYTERTDFD